MHIHIPLHVDEAPDGSLQTVLHKLRSEALHIVFHPAQRDLSLLNAVQPAASNNVFTAVIRAVSLELFVYVRQRSVFRLFENTAT